MTDQNYARLISGQPFKDYQVDVEGVNHSVLKLMSQTEGHARYAFLNKNPKKATQAMNRGNLVQAFIQDVDGRGSYFRWEGNRTTSAGKASYVEAIATYGEDKVILAKDFDQATAMADAVLTCPDAGPFWQNDRKKEIEPTLQWVHSSGVLVKGRPDLVLLPTENSPGVLIDLKTTESAAKSDFERKVFDYGMYTQLEFYRQGLAANGINVNHCILVAVEAEPPYGVAVYRVLDPFLEMAGAQLNSWLMRWAECERTGIWPLYPAGIQDIGIPSWAIKKLETNN
jgi:hypothetical protein